MRNGSYVTIIPQGTVDNNLGPDCLGGPKALYPIQSYKTTNPLFTEPLSGSPYCA